jgi:predicted Zn-dependent protease
MNSIRRAVLPTFLALTTLSGFAAAAPPPVEKTADTRLAVLSAMKDELARSKKRLRMPGEEGPYFIRYLVREYDDYDMQARFGAMMENSYQQVRQGAVEVRVGDYKFDNTADDSAERAFDMEDFERYEPPSLVPIDNSPDALRASLWLLTDTRYKQALATLHKKRGARVTKMVEDETMPSFSREKSAVATDKPALVAFDRAGWEKRLRQVSATFKQYPEIFDSQIKMGVSHQTRYIVTTEGTELINERLIYSIQMSAVSRAKDGLLVSHFKSFYGGNETEMPDLATLERTAAQLAGEIKQLRTAPMMDPFNGPAILLPEAAGVFFHEALGHRLEGERQNDNKEGATFKGQLGKPVLPAFLSVIDDPTLKSMNGISLNGSYGYDDEGVPSRPVPLVEKGVLRNYLKSRTPVKGNIESNGHGRAEGTMDPIGRMASTIVKSDKQVPYAKLKEMLLEEIRRQNKTFGLIIADISGGQTNTTTYDFQAFKGMPRIVYRVDGKTGEETLVRGVEFVGTPIGSLNRIVASSDQSAVFNGFCGAESGYVPVSTVAPAVLISEIELQRTRRALERPPILPAPWR